MKFRAFLRPVAMTKLAPIVTQSSQVDNDDTSLLPNHLPKVGCGVLQWPLCSNISRVPGIMIRLKISIKTHSYYIIHIFLCTAHGMTWKHDTWTHNGRSVYEITAWDVRQFIENHSRMVIWKRIRVSILLLVLSLQHLNMANKIPFICINSESSCEHVGWKENKEIKKSLLSSSCGNKQSFNKDITFSATVVSRTSAW